MSIDYGSLRFMPEPLPDQQQHQRRQAVRHLMLNTPFIGGLGVVFERYEPDDVTIRLPFRRTSPTTARTFTAG